MLRNRNPDNGALEIYRLWSYYRPDGAVEALVRTQTGVGEARPATYPSTSSPTRVVRTFDYDSVGRRLSSDDPDTDDPTNGDAQSNSWRYLFNRVGDLVAVRDPRGCGQNFFYDLGGRLRGEQYVGCAEAQSAAAEQPHGDNSVGHLIGLDYSSASVSLDVVYHYDAYPDWAASIVPAGADAITQGRATGVSDRAQRAVLAYDRRGNVTWTARQLALISPEIGLDPQAVVDGRPAAGRAAGHPVDGPLRPDPHLRADGDLRPRRPAAVDGAADRPGLRPRRYRAGGGRRAHLHPARPAVLGQRQHRLDHADDRQRRSSTSATASSDR